MVVVFATTWPVISPTAVWLSFEFYNSPYNSFVRDIRREKYDMRKNPKWRIWHVPASVRRVMSLLPVRHADSALTGLFFLVRSIESLAQRSHRKHRYWRQSMRRNLGV